VSANLAVPFSGKVSFMTVLRTMRAVAAFVAVSFAVGAAPLGAADPVFTPNQTQAIQDIVRQLLRDNPEILIEAIQAFRSKQEAAEQNRARSALTSRRSDLEKDANSPVGGNPNGNVTVVEFFDYRCGYCKRVHPTIVELLKSDKNVRFVYKEFPILGPESVTAARAALAAFKVNPAKYVAYHDALMTARGNLTPEKALVLAAEVGLEPKAVAKRMEEPDIVKMIAANLALAEELGINGTPAFVIGNQIVPGAVDLETLKKLVAEARKG
jgi:protein-disulfide isomerase